jgi:hypothetical protein
MIIAILFLILFAILFPGTLRFLFVLLLLGGIMILGGAHATAVSKDDISRSLIDSWQTYNEVCRGSTNPELADLACNERQKVGAQLEQIGCIYGNNGAYTPENDGYKCPRNTHPKRHPITTRN